MANVADNAGIDNGVYRLDEDQSIQVLLGGWDTAAVFELVAEHVRRWHETACVVVVLSDGTVGWYVDNGEAL